MTLRVIVVDDEPIVRRRMARLAALEDDVTIVAACANGREAIDAIRLHAPDLVLLDVQMPEVDGFDVIREVGPGRMPVVVFVTAHDQYALRAFEVSAVDYVLKPFSAERFRAALRRACERVAQRGDAEAGRRLRQSLTTLLDAHQPSPSEPGRGAAALHPVAPATPLEPHVDRIAVPDRGRVVLVPIASVDWVEADGNYVRLHTAKTSYLVRELLGALERRLPPWTFARVHRSALVNLDRVHSLETRRSGSSTLVLVDGTRIPVSRRYRKELEERVVERGYQPLHRDS